MTEREKYWFLQLVELIVEIENSFSGEELRYGDWQLIKEKYAPWEK